MLEVNHNLLLDFQVPTAQQWTPLLIICGMDDCPAGATGDEVQAHMTWDPANGSSVVSCLAAARENARIIREVISAEMWERVNHDYLWINSPAARNLYDGHRTEFYNRIRLINQLLHGVGDATMSHGEAWEFCRLGRYLERGSQTARILDVKYHVLLPRVEDVGSPIDHAYWTAILMSCSGYEPFHKTPRAGGLDAGLAVVEFLVYDPLFPRSVARCLQECWAAAAAISASPAGRPATPVELTIADLQAWLAGRDIRTLVRAGLHESLTEVIDRIDAVGAAAHATYFDARPTPAAPAGGQTQRQTQG